MSTKVFRSIPLHVNPELPGDEGANQTIPWFCNLSLLASAANPTSIYAIGLDDPLIDRFMYCTLLNVSVRQTMVVIAEDIVGEGRERPFSVLRRQPNSSIGSFLHQLSRVVTEDRPLKALMMADEEEDEESDDPSALTLMLYFEVESIISPIALSAGIINESEELEFVSLRFEFSRTARVAHVASLALMMATHSRLGVDSMIGSMLGCDALRLICDAYRLRLYECREHVWTE